MGHQPGFLRAKKKAKIDPDTIGGVRLSLRIVPYKVCGTNSFLAITSGSSQLTIHLREINSGWTAAFSPKGSKAG